MNPRELLHALRLFRRTPTATTVALLSIAITVGATAVVFTAVKIGIDCAAALPGRRPLGPIAHRIQTREIASGLGGLERHAGSRPIFPDVPGHRASITTPFSICQAMEACRLKRYMA